MFLILQITSANGATLGPAARAVFTVQGGTIGSLGGNDWVLPDPHVSRRHARVRAVGGGFFLEDNDSTNGVTVNGARLHPGEPYPLKDGDVVFIDPFDIAVSISMSRPDQANPMASSTGSDFIELEPLLRDHGGQPLPPVVHGDGEGSSSGLGTGYPPEAGQPQGFDDLLGSTAGAIDPGYNPLLDPAPSPAPRPQVADLHGRPILNDAMHIPVPPAPPEPVPTASAAAIPDDWYLDAQSPGAGLPPAPPVPTPPVPPVPVATPTPPVATALAAGPGSDLQALLRGAGITEQSLSPEVAAELGAVLRTVIEGLMEVLRARGEIKNEFRLQQTTFKPRENNPLKFSVNVEDALHNLLVKRNPAYLGTTAAFEDAFADVRHHQLAMLAGIRAGFHFMLQRFDPDTLKQQFENRQSRKVNLPFGAHGRLWEQYEEFFRDVTGDADDAFRRLFGDQFGRAYEEQLRHLRASKPRESS